MLLPVLGHGALRALGHSGTHPSEGCRQSGLGLGTCVPHNSQMEEGGVLSTSFLSLYLFSHVASRTRKQQSGQAEHYLLCFDKTCKLLV